RGHGRRRQDQGRRNRGQGTAREGAGSGRGHQVGASRQVTQTRRQGDKENDSRLPSPCLPVSLSPCLFRRFLMPAPVVVMETSLGTIKMELNDQKAPLSAANFLSYVDDKHYDGTIFHRVIDGFMIQGGGFAPGLRQRTTKKPIKNESPNGLSNVR